MPQNSWVGLPLCCAWAEPQNLMEAISAEKTSNGFLPGASVCSRGFLCMDEYGGLKDCEQTEALIEMIVSINEQNNQRNGVKWQLFPAPDACSSCCYVGVSWREGQNTVKLMRSNQRNLHLRSVRLESELHFVFIKTRGHPPKKPSQ